MTDKKENENEIRVEYPNGDYPDTVVVLPKEWRGEHCQKRDAALIASKEYKSVELTNLCVALHLADGFENIPGIEGDDPAKWNLGKTPLKIITWLSEVVNGSFSSDYDVPKNS